MSPLLQRYSAWNSLHFPATDSHLSVLTLPRSFRLVWFTNAFRCSRGTVSLERGRPVIPELGGVNY